MARNFTKLNGTTQYYSAATGLNTGGLTDFEIELLFQTSSSGEQWLFADWDEATSERSFAIRVSALSIQIFASSNGTVATGPIASASVTANELHRVAVTWSSGSVGLTVDDNAAVTGSAGFSTTFANTKPVLFGHKPDAGRFLNGYLADFRMWTGGDRTTGALLASYAIDDTFSATTTLVGTGPTIIANNISGVDSESFTLNTATNPDQWENVGVTVTLPLAYTPLDEGYAVIALIGQSNMIGRASIVGGTDDDYSGIGGAKQYGYNADALIDATNPLDHVNENAGQMGMWLSMVKQLVANGRFAKPIMVVPVAQGGTAFPSWAKGGFNYNAAVARINSAMATSANNTLEAVCWHQGETSADNGSTTHQADLAQMRTDMIADITAMDSGTLWVAGEIKGSSQPANVATINAATQAFINSIPEGRFVTLTDLTIYDTYHFDAASLRTMGERYATEIESVTLPRLTAPFPMGNENGIAAAAAGVYVSINSLPDLTQIAKTTVSWDETAIPSWQQTGITKGTTYNVTFYDGNTGSFGTYNITAS